MTVSPSGTYQTVARPVVTPQVAADSGSAAPAPAAGGDAVFVQTEQLTRLLTAVREAPEVRAEVVAAMAERLAAGEFDTPAAAADAARNLLGGCDC